LSVTLTPKVAGGERYIVAGKYHTLENIFYNLAKVSGIPASKLRLPYKLTVILAWFSDNYAKFTGTKSVIPLEGIKIMHDKIELSSTKAIKELGVNFRPLKETLHDVVDWYRQQGIVK
jgi:dihydroflavonol-4-reductase